MYSFSAMVREIKKMQRKLPLTVYSCGKSLMGRKIYCLEAGYGERSIFLNGSHHGLESITSMLLINYAWDIFSDEGWHKKTSLCIVPMVNPDGVEIASNRISPRSRWYKSLVKFNGSSDFSRTWQANARGVDLNHNYDAEWDLSKQAEKEYGIHGPGPTRYSGEYPESEPETRAISDLTRRKKFDIVLAFHSQGEVIYWDYMGKAPRGALKIAKKMASVSGYALDRASGIASYGGYKDWFIDKFGKPGYTIEIGKGTNPLPDTQLPEIYTRVKPMLDMLIK